MSQSLATKQKRKNKHSLKFLLVILQVLVVLGVLGGLMAARVDDTTDNLTDAGLKDQLTTMTEYGFIQDIGPLAQKAYQKYKILPSLTLAQAILESDFGQSGLAAKYHNLFGVKAYGNVPTVSLDTQEFENGQWITIKGQFRVYDNWQDSVNGHSQLFVEGTTWNPKQYASVLAAKDYKTAAKAVQTSGYATDPDYSTKLISIIEKYKLNSYDKI